MPSQSPPTPLDLAREVKLSERERAILKVTRSNSMSTVAIAEHLGLGSNPGVVKPLLDRLEKLELIDGYYAAGRSQVCSGENLRKYYKVSARGRLLSEGQP
jgi:DNA-binding PadR family transcriptional regulator